MSLVYESCLSRVVVLSSSTSRYDYTRIEPPVYAWFYTHIVPYVHRTTCIYVVVSAYGTIIKIIYIYISSSTRR